MKIFISIIIVCLVIFSLFVCKSPAMQQHKTLEKIMAEGIMQSLEDDKNSDLEYFTVSIGNNNDSVKFKEGGKVYVQLSNSKQSFDITLLHQQHRLCGLKNFMQLAR